MWNADSGSHVAGPLECRHQGSVKLYMGTRPATHHLCFVLLRGITAPLREKTYPCKYIEICEIETSIGEMHELSKNSIVSLSSHVSTDSCYHNATYVGTVFCGPTISLSVPYIGCFGHVELYVQACGAFFLNSYSVGTHEEDI